MDIYQLDSLSGQIVTSEMIVSTSSETRHKRISASSLPGSVKVRGFGHPVDYRSFWRRPMRIASALWGILLAILPAQKLQPVGPQGDANKVVVHRAFQALESGDLKTLNEIFDPKGPIHTPRGKTILQGGPFTDLKSSCPMCASLSNRKIIIDLLLSDGDLVAVRSTWSGKYSGTVRGTTVADKDVSIIYTNIYRIADGKIVENWYMSDSLSLAEQLGMKLVPAEAGK